MSKVNKGESYIYSDGSWSDWTESGLLAMFNEASQNMFVTDNFSIKAYMVAKQSEPAKKDIAACAISGVKAKTYNGKKQTQSITVKDGATTLKEGTDYSVSYKNNKNAGKATMTVKGEGAYAGEVAKAFTIKKAANPITAKGKTVTASAKKTMSFTKSKAFKISKAQGAVTFKKTSGNKKVTVNKKTGKVTVKKGLKKGKTYKVKVKVTAAGNKNYKAATKTATVTVRVK